MTNPYQQGSQGFQDSDTPASSSGLLPRRFSYASVVSSGPNTSNPPFLSHPGRTSVISHLLNSPDDTAFDTASDYNLGTSRNGMQADLNGAGQGGRPWRHSSQLPSISKAFNLFMASRDPADGSDETDSNAFFIPSYLTGSTYVQRLEESYRLKLQAQRDAQNQAISPASPGAIGLHNQSASHRGLSYDIVEKPPPSFEEDEVVSSLPTKWNKDDKYGALEVLADGLEIRYIGPRTQSDRERDHEAYSIRADNYMPPQCGIYYYEVTILSGKRDDTVVGIGFSGKSVALSRPPGWEPESYGYHGDDGHCYAAHSGGKSYGPPFTTDDVIGCGVNFRTGTAFYTKNGHMLGHVFKDIKGKLYPSVGLKKTGEHIRVNFGQSPFTYDINSMMAKEKLQVRKEIARTNTASLANNMKETDLIQTLVLQFLQHDGYVESARAFAQEIHGEKKALSLDPDAVIDDINVKDDEHATKRQHIRRAVLEGDIDKALKLTEVYYRDVLKDNEQVYFRLRCRRFIEMVRSAAEMRTATEGKKSNGHVALGFSNQAMDLDANGAENGTYDRMDTEDGNDRTRILERLELETLQYGQALQTEYASDPRREVTKALGEIYALLAYTNPLQEKEVAHLLDKKGRVAVAEELNSAILLSLGKSSRSALEEVYAQTSVLLDDLRENGGPGAFVSLQDVIDGIPKPQDN
ncbi:hypothetical protein ACHAQA_001713 [Verticillium albo-atrum]